MNKETIRIIIVGAGVIGLTTAIRLFEAGYQHITIVTDANEMNVLNTNSAVAGALWRPYDGRPEEKFWNWCERSLTKFNEYAKNSKITGVSFITAVEHFPEGSARPGWLNLVDACKVPESALRQKPKVGREASFAGIVPVIDTPMYLKFLKTTFKKKGGKFLYNTKIRNIECYAKSNNAHITINCVGHEAGMISTALKDADKPKVFPIRGQVIKLKIPDQVPPEEIYAVGMEPTQQDPAITYIIPRPISRTVIIGGTYEKQNCNQTVNKTQSKDILKRCAQLAPWLNVAEILETKVGLRAGSDLVYLQMRYVDGNHGKRIIDNVGHGGAGFTASWGCADEVLALCDRYRLQQTKKITQQTEKYICAKL